MSFLLSAIEDSSSVARGGGGGRGGIEPPPIDLCSMQNRTFLVVLRSIFSEKLNIAPPIGKQPPLKRLDFRVGPNNQSQNWRRPFFFFFFFFFLETT